MSAAEPPEPPVRSRSSRSPWVSLAVGVAIVGAVVVAFVLLREGDEEPPAPNVGASGATAVSPRPVASTPERLVELSSRLKRPIYWVGPSRGRIYELTQTADDSIYVRYLEGGARIGDPRPDFLTVGTYPQREAFDTITKASERADAQVEELDDDDGLAVANASRPNSWYVAFPDSDELIEVFSPKAGRARELVRTGRLVPVKG